MSLVAETGGLMDRRNFLIGGAATVTASTSTAAVAQTFVHIPRDQDPMVQASGEPVFAKGPLAGNVVAEQFGQIPKTHLLPPDIPYSDANGPRGFHELTGKVRILALWAEWAQPSVKVLPDLAALQTRYGGDRFEILAIRTGGREAIEYAAARKIVDDAGASALPLWIEPDNGYMSMAMVRSAKTIQMMTEGRPSIPAAVLVDDKGMVRGRMIGIRTGGKPRNGPAATPSMTPAERAMAAAMADRPTIWTSPDADAFIKGLIAGA